MRDIGLLVIRADASPSIGVGHVMRCLALAQVWIARGGQVSFAMAECPESLHLRLQQECAVVVPLEERTDPQELSRKSANAAWIVIDGYQFTADYINHLVQFGSKVLLVDDEGRLGLYNAQLVLNQNIYASRSMYEDRTPSTKLLLGTKYAMIRNEFSAVPSSPKGTVKSENLLATFGGSDPAGLSMLLLQALSESNPFKEVRLVLGGANKHLRELRAQCEQLPGVALVEDVHDMPQLMRWADIAICAAGSTTWELCYFGIPMILIAAANNQVAVGRSMGEHLAALYLGEAAEITPGRMSDALDLLQRNAPLRQQYASGSKPLVDGKGAVRVVKAMLNEEES